MHIVQTSAARADGGGADEQEVSASRVPQEQVRPPSRRDCLACAGSSMRECESARVRVCESKRVRW